MDDVSITHGPRLYEFSYLLRALSKFSSDFGHHRWSGRILRAGLLFLVLITGATYTANLAAYFTAPAIVVRGAPESSPWPWILV